MISLRPPHPVTQRHRSAAAYQEIHPPRSGRLSATYLRIKLGEQFIEPRGVEAVSRVLPTGHPSARLQKSCLEPDPVTACRLWCQPAEKPGELAAGQEAGRLQATIRQQANPTATAAGAFGMDPRRDGMAIPLAQAPHHGCYTGLLIHGHLSWRGSVEHRGAVLERWPVVPVHDELLQRPVLPARRPARIVELPMEATDRASAPLPASEVSSLGWFMHLGRISQLGLHGSDDTQ